MSHLALIAFNRLIIAGALNLKMAGLHFVNVSEEVIDIIVENSIVKSTKCATEFGKTLFKRKI